MSKWSRWPAWLVFGMVAVAAHAADSGSAERGEEIAVTCVACHQADGSGANVPGGESWPRMAGLNADYLYKQLQSFKDGSRESATMQAFAGMLNEQQMRDISAYYAEMPPTPGKGGEEADDATLALGEKLATRGDWERYIPPCAGCHGPDNLGVGNSFPAIAGQNAGYIADQIRAWQAQRRNNDPLNLMAAIAERMDDRQIEAVSAWLARQPSSAQQ